MSLKSGETIEFKAWPAITIEQLRAYAEASGDHNPIHVDEAVAKKAGLPGIIAHGMLTAGFMGERALQVVRGDSVLAKLRLRSFQTRFKAMTLLGDVVSIGGSVKEASPDRVTLELQARNQKGEVTTTAVAQFEKIG